ncbi:MAG: co-chaperone GroES [Terriglobia bacterium]
MAVNVRPLHDRILVRLLETVHEEAKSKGGIIIPDTARRELARQGEVLAVGKGRKKEDGTIIPLDVKVGDRVVFGKYAGTEIAEDLILIEEKEILGVVDPTAVGAKK